MAMFTLMRKNEEVMILQTGEDERFASGEYLSGVRYI